MRIRPERAAWKSGYQSQALYDNSNKTRLPVISIFREQMNRDTAQAGWSLERHGHVNNETGGDPDYRTKDRV